jgi:hypothetical protein
MVLYPTVPTACNHNDQFISFLSLGVGTIYVNNSYIFLHDVHV